MYRLQASPPAIARSAAEWVGTHERVRTAWAGGKLPPPRVRAAWGRFPELSPRSSAGLGNDFFPLDSPLSSPVRLLALAFPLFAFSAGPSAQCEIQALKGKNTVFKDFFGKSCCISGERLAVGAFASTTGRPGSVHVFEHANGQWVQTARLQGDDSGAGDELGNSVGISGDYVVSGAEYHDGPAGSNSGAAYVWKRGPDGKWTQVQKLLPHDSAAQDNFGEYVAIEGDVIAIGERFDETLGNNAGAAYVFERGVDGVWTETAKLIGSAAKRNDLSADTLAIDGGRILMASYRSDASGSHSGSAYLFEKLDGKWKETARLVANDGAGELSRGVAIDGDRIVLGARLDSTKGDAAGAGYVFEKWNGEWTQTAKLLPSSASALDWIGEAVAVRGDRIVLSGHHHDQIGSNSGVAYVFELQNGQWVETKVLQSSAASQNDEFSFALSMSGDTLLGTSPFDGGNVGAAYLFSFRDDLCSCGGTGSGTVTPIGTSLSGANIGKLATESSPAPNTTMLFSISGIPSGTTGTLFLSPASVQRLAYGGTLLVTPSTAPIKLSFRLNLGSATVGWRVPLSLCGTKLYAQAVVLDATQPLGRALTNGLELAIGD